jgi:hypothetical protein
MYTRDVSLKYSDYSCSGFSIFSTFLASIVNSVDPKHMRRIAKISLECKGSLRKETAKIVFQIMVKLEVLDINI